MKPLTIDQQGTVRRRTQLLATGGALVAGAILAILVAVVVDGLASRRPRKSRKDGAARGAGAPTPRGGEASEAEASAIPDPDDLVAPRAAAGPG